MERSPSAHLAGKFGSTMVRGAGRHCALLVGLLGRIFSISIAWVALPTLALPQPLPRSILILDQSDRDSTWYRDFAASFREALNTRSATRVSLYAEHLDLSRFG